MSELPITDLSSLSGVLQEMARSLKLSLTALIGANGSLLSLATGARINQDTSLGPLLRTFNRADWEMVARPAAAGPVILHRPGTLPLAIIGVGGEPIEITVNTMDDLAVMIATLAMTMDRTTSGMIKAAGSSNTSLVSFVTGHDRDKDVRLLNLLRVTKFASFSLFARPRFQSKRDARLHTNLTRGPLSPADS